MTDSSQRPLNLPWRIEYIESDDTLRSAGEQWLILDRWGVVIGRFDFESQARTVVAVTNEQCAADRRKAITLLYRACLGSVADIHSLRGHDEGLECRRALLTLGVTVDELARLT